MPVTTRACTRLETSITTGLLLLEHFCLWASADRRCLRNRPMAASFPLAGKCITAPWGGVNRRRSWIPKRPLHAPASFTLRWNSGVNATRRLPWWPVTYAIYYKAWLYGAAEPASYTLFSSGLQCNPDSSGVCSMPVSNIAAGNYRFYVIANMDESLPTGRGIQSTQSPTSYFTVGYQPIATIPAPLPPNPIYPSDGTLHVPGNFTLRWNDGLDASRRSPFWPVTY